MSIDAKQIAGLVQKAAKQVASQATPTPAMETLAAAPTTPTKGNLKSLANGAVDLLKAVAPDLVGLIPGVGPIAKLALTTLNDDEWFGEFKGAGVTANEFLQLSTYGDDVFSAVSGCTFVQTMNNVSEEFKSNFMPAILAYVRNHTNNVLVDDTTLYSVAFDAATQLYALYYEGLKYIKLSEHQPLNIPILSEAIPAIEPRTYSQFKGIVEALGDFLKTSVRLPYAWVEYIRWRYGTTFYSENTGKPGLIFYDLVLGCDAYGGAEGFLNAFQYSVNAGRNNYVSAGRAGADLKLAYDNHQIRYDVEDAHHDAKEFNLRTNLACGLQGTTKYPANGDNAFIFLDSRLDQSAALQAVTISTPTGLQPFYVNDIWHAVYVRDELPVDYIIVKGPAAPDGVIENVGATATLTKGWHCFRSLAASTARDVKANGGKIPCFVVNGVYDVNGITRYQVGLADGVALEGLGLIAEPVAIPDPDGFLDRKVGIPLAPAMNEGYYVYNSRDSMPGDADAISVFLTYHLSFYMLTSLQFHNTGLITPVGGVYLATTPLSYDTAYVSKESIRNIQRTAMRNLTRGNYRAKIQTTSRSDVREAVADVETAVLNDLKDQSR